MTQKKKVKPIGFLLNGCFVKVTAKGRYDNKFKIKKGFKKQQNSSPCQSSPPFQKNNLICHHNQDEPQKVSQQSNLPPQNSTDISQHDFRQLNSPSSYGHDSLQHSYSTQPPDPGYSFNDNESCSFLNLQMPSLDLYFDNFDMDMLEFDSDNFNSDNSDNWLNDENQFFENEKNNKKSF